MIAIVVDIRLIVNGLRVTRDLVEVTYICQIISKIYILFHINYTRDK
jgi:hypothetical protein